MAALEFNRSLVAPGSIERANLFGPYSKLIEILRFTLEQVEKDASFNPESRPVAELKRSLHQTLVDLERRTKGSELDG